MKKLFFALCILFITSITYAQEIRSNTLYQTGVYGQTFELIEVTDGEGCILLIRMYDNKNTNKFNVKTYDSELPTQYYIFSDYYTNAGDYSKAIEKCKSFLNTSMNLIYLADIKDICDIAPCCEFVNYCVQDSDNNEKCIHIEYDCNDLDLLFTIASQYNAKGRAFVLEKYVK